MWDVNSFDTGILLFLNQFARRSFTWDALVSTVEGMNLLKGGAVMGFVLYIWFRGGENKARDGEFVIFSFMISAAALVTARTLALTLPFESGHYELRLFIFSFHAR